MSTAPGATGGRISRRARRLRREPGPILYRRRAAPPATWPIAGGGTSACRSGAAPRHIVTPPSSISLRTPAGVRPRDNPAARRGRIVTQPYTAPHGGQETALPPFEPGNAGPDRRHSPVISHARHPECNPSRTSDLRVLRETTASRRRPARLHAPAPERPPAQRAARFRAGSPRASHLPYPWPPAGWRPGCRAQPPAGSRGRRRWGAPSGGARAGGG